MPELSNLSKRNHLVRSSPSGRLVDKKDSYQRSSWPRTVLFGDGTCRKPVWSWHIWSSQERNYMKLQYTTVMLRYSFGDQLAVYGVNGTHLAQAPSTHPAWMYLQKKVVKAACQGGPPVRFMGIIWVESSNIEDVVFGSQEVLPSSEPALIRCCERDVPKKKDPSDRCDSSFFRVRLHYAALKGHIARVPEPFVSGKWRLNSCKNAIMHHKHLQTYRLSKCDIDKQNVVV